MDVDVSKSNCTLQGIITWSETWGNKHDKESRIERWEAIWGFWNGLSFVESSIR